MKSQNSVGVHRAVGLHFFSLYLFNQITIAMVKHLINWIEIVMSEWYDYMYGYSINIVLRRTFFGELVI